MLPGLPDLDKLFHGDRASWESLALEALRGRPLSSLTASSLDGIDIPALAPLPPPRRPEPGRAAGLPWSMVQVVHADGADVNRHVIEALSGGATAISFDVMQPEIKVPGKVGALSSQSTLKSHLEAVHIEMIQIHVYTPFLIAPLLDLASGLEQRVDGRPAATLHFGIDAVKLAETGHNADLLARAAALPATHGVAGTIATFRGQEWHLKGAGDRLEVALAIAAGASVIRHWFNAGLGDAAVAALSRRIEFRLVASQAQLMTMAKFRAFRRLWALTLEAAGLPPAPAFVHAEPSLAMFTRYDPWSNILRSTIAAFAAGVGGADAVTTLPHTVACGTPDAAARRLARNVQVMLMEEAGLHRVGDPAAGAAGIEAMTESLAEASWEDVRRIEADGGLGRALAKGWIGETIGDLARRRGEAVARRRLPVTGVSTYPQAGERAPLLDGPQRLLSVEDDRARLAAPWEALRDRAVAAIRDGQRPAVFIATLGSVAGFTARATWMRNLLEAAGLIVTGGDHYPDMTALTDAFRADGAPAAAICGDEATYADQLVPAISALRAAGAETIILAGKPRTDAAGIDIALHEGLDMLVQLTALQARFGLADREASHG